VAFEILSNALLGNCNPMKLSPYLLRLCALVFVSAIVILPAQGARLALVIGNDAYKQVEPLKNARNDARLMVGVLKKAGFEVNSANDLTRDGLWNTIDTFKSRIQKGDEVVFYFAGHGVQINSNQLLLPVDIAAKSDAQVQRDGVPLIDIQDALKDARFALLLIDACRDNPFPKTGTRGIGGTRGLERAEPSTGQIIMMSAGRNQKALDKVPGEAVANGLFTWELAQALQTPGVEIRAALEQVKDRVDDKAKRAGHEQRPSLVNDLKGNFYLVPGEAVQVASVRAEPVINQIQVPVAASTGGRETPENALWAEVSKTNNKDDYEAYLTQYPKGKYAGLARVRIKRMQDEQTGQQEVLAWESADRTGNVSGYQTYLDRFADGNHASLAKEKIAGLRKAESEIAAREEQTLWAQAQSGDSAQALQTYLEKYPSGIYADAARKQVEALGKAATLIVFRESAYAGSGSAHAVYVNGKHIGTPISGSYLVYRPQPGELKFSSSCGGMRTAALSMSVESNTTYYVQFSLGFTGCDFEQVNSQTGANAIRGLRNLGAAAPADPDAMSRLFSAMTATQGGAVKASAGGKLGVQFELVTPEVAAENGSIDARGARVRSVLKDSPAEKAGLLAGDILLVFDGKTIDTYADLPRIVASTLPGTRASATVLRHGTKMTILVVVGGA
jgi:uncharacterized caspase-like protein